jgi:hypothetical protein
MRIIKSQVVPLESVKPNDYNPNEMEEREFTFLKDMIDKYGFSQALVVTSDFVIIDGEQRWTAAKELGAKEIEVKVLPVTLAEAKTLTINYNRIKGNFNPTLLGSLIQDLSVELGFDTVSEMVVIDPVELKLLNEIMADLPEVGEAATDDIIRDIDEANEEKSNKAGSGGALAEDGFKTVTILFKTKKDKELFESTIREIREIGEIDSLPDICLNAVQFYLDSFLDSDEDDEPDLSGMIDEED